MMPRLMTPDEAAEMLGVNPRTLLKWARSKYVPAHPLGEGRRRIWRFFRDELEQFIEQQGTFQKAK